MNIQYQNEQENSLLGSYRQRYTADYNTVPKDPQKQMIHKIAYGDTLQGLSLTYSVPIAKIKQRNNLHSEQIYFLKEIIIPDPERTPEPKQEELEFMKIEQFLCYMLENERSSKTARYYLSENGWDVQKAVQEYRDDLEWQRKNKIRMKNLTESFTKMQQNKRERTEIQMMLKKRQ